MHASRFSGKTALAVICLAFPPAVALSAQGPGRCDCRSAPAVQWLVQSPPPSDLAIWREFEAVLFGALERGFQVERREASADEIVAALRADEHAQEKPAAIVYGSLRCFQRLQDEGLTTRLRLEPINARLLSYPLHIFTSEAVWKDTETRIQRKIRIRYFADYEIDEAKIRSSIEQILRPILGTGAKGYDIAPWPSPDNMAQYLLEPPSNRFDVVIFFAEAPSVFVGLFLEDFILARTTVSGSTGELPLLLPIDREKFALYGLMQIPDGLDLFVVEEANFYGLKVVDSARAGLPQGAFTVSMANTDTSLPVEKAFPIIATNLRERRPCCLDALRETLSDAYVSILPLIEHERLAAEPSGRLSPREQIYRTYLLNAILADRDNTIRGLLLYGHLAFASERDEVDDAEKRRLLHEANIVLEALKLVEPDPPDPSRGKKRKERTFSADTLFSVLGVSDTGVRREQYSRHSIPYGTALEKIDAGELEEARRLLLVSLYGGTKPASVQRASGLWSVPEYDPYWQLTRIELLERGYRDPGKERPFGILPP